MNKFLGKGTYGSVYQAGNIAIKKFTDSSSLIQEYAAGRYLNNSGYTVEVYECNLKELTLSMKLYQGTLRDWLSSDRSEEQSLVAFRKILEALTYMSDILLVHGDLKPGNILCNWKPNGDIIDLVIGDLGFVSIERFAKANRTAPAYLEKVVVKDHKHDIYSLGVIALQMFGNFRVSKRYEPHQLIELTNKNVVNPTLRRHIISCFLDDRKERPTSRYLLYTIFSIKQELIECKLPIKVKDESDGNQLKNFMRETGQKTLGVFRCKSAYDACISFLVRESIPLKYYIVYGCSTLVIYSALFGKSGYTIEMASRYSGINVNRVRLIIETLINNKDFLDMVFFTTIHS